ncbi:MAG: 50S ribosomal protein L3 [Chromatiales bacterium]|nr:50S ribosomal protein L3 [Chromatiales bacterium]
MAIGVIGQKEGMSRIFREQGDSVPCTIIRVIPNRICQVKTMDNDGYQALQLVGGQNRKASNITRPMKGHFRKTSVQAGKEIHEFRVSDREIKKTGAEIGVEIFSEGQKVRVTGISKGKGFAGTIKRHNFHGQDNSHGNSLSHRVMGSVGQCQFPGRVFKGKKMPGQMGNARVTVKNLEIVKVDKERQLLWIKGAVPGSRNNTVLIRHLSDIDIQAVSPDLDPQQQPSKTEQKSPTTTDTAVEQTAEAQPADDKKSEAKPTSVSQAAKEPENDPKTEEASPSKVGDKDGT